MITFVVKFVDHEEFEPWHGESQDECFADLQDEVSEQNLRRVWSSLKLGGKEDPKSQ